jgi:hypothetical protein
MKKAVQTLMSSGVMDLSPDVLQKLAALHPQPKEAVPACPAEAPRLSVIADDILDVSIRKICNGSAPGASGWSAEHLKVLVSDQVCREGIKHILMHIINNNVDERTRQILIAGILVAVAKDSSAMPDPRPIAMGEVFYKLAGVYVLELMLKHFPEIFPDIQLGVGAPGGSERAIHALNALCSLHDTALLICTDFKNAYNSKSRAGIARSLYGTPSTSACWRIFDLAYSSPSALLLYDKQGQLVEVLSSQEGVRQGDPLSSFYFSISAQPLYKRSTQGTSTTAKAVIDDLNLIGPAASVFSSFDKLRSQCGPSSDLVLQVPKCFAVWPHASDPPPDVVDGCRTRDLRLIRGWHPVLGAPVGDLRSYASEVQAWIAKEVNSHDAFFANLSHKALSCQNSTKILRSCGLPRLNYLARTVPRTLFLAAAAAFDKKILSSYLNKMQIHEDDLTAVGLAQLQLPINLAGVGLRPYTFSCSAAFLASFLQVLPDVLPLFDNDINTLARKCNFLLSEAATCLKEVRSHAHGLLDSNSDLPPTLLECIRKYANEAPAQLQRKIVREMENALYRNVSTLPATSATDRARLRSASMPHAGDWLRADAKCPEHQMNDTHYATASKILLNAHPPSAGRCRCGAEVSSDSHYLQCTALVPTAATARHNDILRVIEIHSGRFKVEATVSRKEISLSDCRDDDNDHELIPDAEFSFPHPHGTVLIDVSVTHPAAPSHVHLSSPAASRETDKNRKYRAAAAQQRARFIPFVMETHGAYGPSADRLLSIIAEQEDHLGFRPAIFEEMLPTTHVKVSLSTALQRGNAAMIAMGQAMNARTVGPRRQ